MATIRDGNRPVLAIVDAQAGVMADCHDAARVLANIAAVVDRARAARVPVVWVQHGDAELVPGSAAWQWAAPLAPAASEPVVPKRYNSAFEQTPFESELARLGATHVVLAGAASAWCIRATAHALLERGYDLTLVADGHSTDSIELDDGQRIDAADVVRQLNVAIDGLEYPGRVNGTAPAATLDFSRPGQKA